MTATHGRYCNNKATDFKHGDIIWGPYIHPNIDPNAVVGDEKVIYSEITGFVCAKDRPYVILGIWPDYGILGAPIFTSTNRGITAVPNDKRGDCVVLINATDPVTAIDGVSKDRILRVSNVPDKVSGVFNVHKGAYVPLTQCALLRFDYPLEKHGRVESASLFAMQSMHQRLVKDSYYDPKAARGSEQYAAQARRLPDTSHLKESVVLTKSAWARR